MQKLEQVLTKRFFLCPSFEIYGGISGLYDYGPPMTALQANLLELWRRHFVLEENMLEVECTNLTPEVVLKTSGHVDRFADYMVRDLQTGDIYRADHLVKQTIEKRLLKQQDKDLELILETLDNYQGKELGELMQKLQIASPLDNPLSEPVLFNLMFDTQIGPTGQFKGYLRPETAQGHFLNFKRLLEFNNEQMPFASASIGKSFRNEISPRQGLLRVREFTMAEIEHYVHPDKKQHPKFASVKDLDIPLYSSAAQLNGQGASVIKIGDAVAQKMVDNETLGYFIARIYLFLVRIGINPQRIRFRQHMQNEMAHYATDCWDAEIQSSYGWIESVGCADRSAYDLTAHSKKSGQKLVARETLPEPIMRTGRVLEIAKAKFGPAFKKDARLIQNYFDALSQECDYQAQLDKIESDLKASGKTVVELNGNKYDVTSEMVKVVEKTEKISVLEYTPNVIEPSFGIGRILYALLEHNFDVRPDSDQRTYFKFPASVAPTKALILPISNNAEFEPIIADIVKQMRAKNLSNRVDSSSGSIGRRYARNDELGTPFAITVDFDTLKDKTVTLRERDSCKQIRQDIPTIVDICAQLVGEQITWKQVEARFKTFTAASE